MRAIKNVRAFTLIELLLVLVILAVLAAVAVPLYVGRAEQARRSGTIAEINHLKGAVGAFEVDNGRYPSASEGLTALFTAPSDVTNTWHGPYLDRTPTDKWGNAYAYEYPAAQGPSEFNIISAAKDGQFGTNDDIDVYTVN